MIIEQVVHAAPIEVRNSQQEMAELTAPVAEPVVRQLRALIEQEANETGLAHREGAFERLTGTRAKAAAAQRTAEESEVAESAAREAAARAKPGSGWQGTLFAAAGAICFGAEFALTLVTLPYVLGLHQWSVLGVVLAIAPTTAVLVLDKVLARLVEDPWEAIHQTTKTWHRYAATAVMVCFLLVLGVGNLWTVSLLADAREHATVLRREAERKSFKLAAVGAASTAKDNEDRAVVKQAVWAVSIFVTLDGALFSLLTLSEMRRRRGYRKSQREAGRALAERDSRRGELTDAQSELAAREQQWLEIDERVRVWSARYREERTLQLEKALAKLPDARSGRDVVTSILTGQRAPQKLAIAV